MLRKFVTGPRRYQHLMHRGVEPFSHETTSYKLADLGNACWLNRQFAQEIRPRQYRSLEVRAPLRHIGCGAS